MTELKLAYNDIPRRSVLSSSSTQNTDYPHENLFFGGRSLFWQSAAAVTESLTTFDLGSGITASSEYFIASGVNSMISQTPGTLTIQLRASTDNFAASDVLIFQKASIVSADLVGTYSEDLVVTGAASTAYRYWRIKITSSNAIFHKLRKFYFGSFFDFGGVSPKYPYSVSYNVGQRQQAFVSDAGPSFATSSGRAKMQVSLTWPKITDAIRNDFFQKVARYAYDYPIFLFEADSFSHTIFPSRLVLGFPEVVYSSGDKWKDSGELQIVLNDDIIG